MTYLIERLRSFYYRLPKAGVARAVVIQIFIISVAIFNSAKDFLPFFCWKRFLCRIVGIRVASDVVIHNGVRFLSFGRCCINTGTIVNRDVIIDNREPIVIGKNVSIATRSAIFTQGHAVDSDGFEIVGGAVEIGDYACLFASCMIMPRVKIGRGAVVYPGAVVTKDIPDMLIVGGNPARIIRKRVCSMSYGGSRGFWWA